MLPNNAPDARKANRKRIFKRILLVCVILAAVGLALLAGLNLYVVSSAEPYILTEEQAAELSDVDCIIVLGALVYSDGTMSDVLRHRVEMGTALFEAGVSDRILMSGDHSRENYDEVGTMKDYAVAAGVSPDCVFKDHAGLDTYSTMYRAKEIFQAQKVVIVTQKFHISRAVYLARALGLEAYGVACDQGEYTHKARNELRETLARVKAVWSAIVQPEPEYLGDAARPTTSTTMRTTHKKGHRTV